MSTNNIVRLEALGKGLDSMKGTLLVIDGLDGSGKQTQARKLEERLRQTGRQILRVSFPDYSQPSSALVKMYLSGEFGSDPEDVPPYAASSFYAVDRYASYKRFWEQAYLQGTIILADRYATSNAIYQMTKLPREQWREYLEWMEDYEYVKLALPRPSCVIYLDMPTEVSQKLMTSRYHGDESKKDIHESHVSFLRQCRETALFTAEKQGWHVISCAVGEEPRKIDDISDDIFSKVLEVI